MIKELEIENYKAFKNAKIKFKPITILLGANSVGKTSIMQLPLLYNQSLRPSTSNPELKLNGNKVNLGEAQNLFHKLNTKKNIKIGWKITPNGHFKADFKRLFDHFEENLNTIFDRCFQLNHYLLNRDDISDKRYQRDMRFQKSINTFIENNDSDQDIITRLKSVRQKIRNTIRDRKLNVEDIVKLKELKNFIDTSPNFVELKTTYDYLEKISSISSKELTYSTEYGFRNNDSSIIIVAEEVKSGSDILIGYKNVSENRGRDFKKFYSDFINDKVIQKYSTHLNKNVTNKYSNRLRFLRDGVTLFNSLPACIELVFSEIYHPFKGNFTVNKITSIGPLRAFPKRYYFLDGSLGSGGSLSNDDGDRLSKKLKENKDLKKEVNLWLKKFGLEVNVSKLKDIIHHLKVSQNGIDLDITDVGFGISQILPVIVHGYSAIKDSLTIVEQPEIHLHPRMQAETADLFISMAKITGSNFLIETHSEYLLRRLKRRMAEGTISPNDVSIYFVTKEKNHSIAKEISIDSGGAFKFPSEFYVDELDDTFAFISNYKNEK